jgi:hypothetical protein
MSASVVSQRGRLATSPRLIAGLLYLQHPFDLSDEDVVWQWLEKPYWVRRQGECVGQLWSHETVYVPDADALQYVEGNTSGRDIASACQSGVVVGPVMHTSALHGNREIPRLTWRCSGLLQRLLGMRGARASRAVARGRIGPSSQVGHFEDEVKREQSGDGYDTT